MAWTRKERKEHIAEKYYPRRKKLFILILVIIIIVLLVYSLIYSVQINNIPLSVLLLVAMFVTILLSIFAVDMMVWESQ